MVCERFSTFYLEGVELEFRVPCILSLVCLLSMECNPNIAECKQIVDVMLDCN